MANSRITIDPSLAPPPDYARLSRITVDPSIAPPPTYSTRSNITIDPSISASKGTSQGSSTNIIVDPSLTDPNDGPAPPYQGPPICLYPHLVSHSSTTLIMKSDLWTTSATITTAAGIPTLRIDAEVFSLSHRKHIFDANGLHLFTMRKDVFKFGNGLPSYFLESPRGDGARLFELQNKWTWGGSRAVASFTNALSQTPESLEMKGDFFNLLSTITDVRSGLTVAEIDRKLWRLKDTYQLTILAGVDVSVVVAMCVMLEDRERERRRR